MLASLENIGIGYQCSNNCIESATFAQNLSAGTGPWDDEVDPEVEIGLRKTNCRVLDLSI